MNFRIVPTALVRRDLSRRIDVTGTIKKAGEAEACRIRKRSKDSRKRLISCRLVRGKASLDRVGLAQFAFT